jgi:hypothetical protein
MLIRLLLLKIVYLTVSGAKNSIKYIPDSVYLPLPSRQLSTLPVASALPPKDFCIYHQVFQREEGGRERERERERERRAMRGDEGKDREVGRWVVP